MASATALQRNVTAFIAFRVLFSARFYYPVFAILFLDYGLSLEQFALLNVLWAAAIVVLEVPSGALADRWGRKRMVQLAAGLMVLEMAVLVAVPLEPGWLVFAAFAVNRVLSGAAEACASGADEALAYDSLKALGREAEWPAVLRRLMRWQSAAFVAAMVLGAGVYDPGLWNGVAAALGQDLAWTKAETLRLPVVLTLATGLAACAVTARLREPPGGVGAGEAVPVRAVWGQILAAGRWILGRPWMVAVLGVAMLHDSFIRLILTLQSGFLREIGYPEASLGGVAAVLAGLGLGVAPLAAWMDRRGGGLGWKFSATAVATVLGLAGMAGASSLWGLGWVVLLHGVFGLAAYFLSQVLHAQVDSAHRATVLSFKGLAFNLGYGLVGLAYGAAAGLTGPEAPFTATLAWLPWAFAVLVGGAGGVAWWQAR
jgi:hypothetical protein